MSKKLSALNIDTSQLTGSTSPRRVISPVIAVSERTHTPVKRDASTVAIVMPADGPSLPTAPAGK